MSKKNIKSKYDLPTRPTTVYGAEAPTKKEYDKLRTKWDKILEKTGFKDIEPENRRIVENNKAEMDSVRGAVCKPRKIRTLSIHQKTNELFHRRAGYFNNHFEWAEQLKLNVTKQSSGILMGDKEIWECFCNGKKVSKSLKKSTTTVWNRMQVLKKIMEEWIILAEEEIHSEDIDALDSFLDSLPNGKKKLSTITVMTQDMCRGKKNTYVKD